MPTQKTKIISNALFNSTTQKAQINFHNGNSESVFFKPIRDRYDFYSRAASVPLAIVGIGIQALEDLAMSLHCLVMGLLKSLVCDWSGSKNEFKGSWDHLVCAVQEVIAALISPLANLIDLIGGGIKAISEDNPNDRIRAHINTNKISFDIKL